MKEHNDINELNSDNFYFGIPCHDCFDLTRSIQGKFKDVNKIKNFLKKYSICPLCYSENHESYLTSFYHDNSKSSLKLKKSLEFLEKNQKYKGMNLDFGIPCCNCFQKIFDQPEFNIGVEVT
ncbi:MAG: hypothetical protein EU550_01645 [Promethearchaeota archaeon]|nr:MAG: hypothetical protein EU550_01645 [Candidatus Lokiarchaeota archaeon]